MENKKDLDFTKEILNPEPVRKEPPRKNLEKWFRERRAAWDKAMEKIK